MNSLDDEPDNENRDEKPEPIQEKQEEQNDEQFDLPSPEEMNDIRQTFSLSDKLPDVIGYDDVHELMDLKTVRELINYANHLTHAVVQIAAKCGVKLHTTSFVNGKKIPSEILVDPFDQKAYSQKRIMLTLLFLYSRINFLTSSEKTQSSTIENLKRQVEYFKIEAARIPEQVVLPPITHLPYVLGRKVMANGHLKLCFLSFNSKEWRETYALRDAIRFAYAEMAEKNLAMLVRSTHHAIPADKFKVMQLHYSEVKSISNLKEKGQQVHPGPASAYYAKVKPLPKSED